MKKIILFLVFGISLAFTTNDADKKYPVIQSINKWQQDINIIEVAKQYLKQSDLPTKAALPLIDSLSRIQNDFIEQLKPQIDTVKKK